MKPGRWPRVAAALLLLGAAAWAGFEAGRHQLASGVATHEMARLGLRRLVRGDYRGTRVKPIWHPAGERFVFVVGEGESRDFRLVDVAKGGIEPFAPGLRGALEGRFAEASEAPLPRTLEFVDADAIELVYRERRVRYDLETREARFVVEALADGTDPLVPRVAREMFPQVWPDEREIVSPRRDRVLTLDGPNLAVRDRAGAVTTLTLDGAPLAEWYLRASAWSPDGRLVASLQVDSRTSGRVPVVDWADLDSPPRFEPFPMAHAEGLAFRGALIDVASGRRLDLDFGRDVYVRPVGWRPDGSEALFARLARDGRRFELLAADAATGALRTLFDEETDGCIQFPPNFLFRVGPPLVVLPEGLGFLWISDRTGRRQLRHYDRDGKFVQQLTDGDFPVAEIVGYGRETGEVVYLAPSDAARPYDRQVHAVPLAGGASRVLSPEPGRHAVHLSPTGRYYVDTFSTVATPPRVHLRDAEGRDVFVLSVGEPVRGAGLVDSPPEPFTALAADGRSELHGVIYKPSNFDPTKSYPVLDSIYAGPFVNYVPYAWDARVPFFGSEMAELGYVVVAVDARGTPGRDAAFSHYADGRLGDFEASDHRAAIESAAATRPWMDTSRVGVMGHSYGGYFTLRFLLQEPDFFRVGVASGLPELDERSAGIATECYLGALDQHPEHWARAANAPRVGDLVGRLLIIAMTSDVNTPLHGTFRVIEALNEAGKRYDVLLFPGANHGLEGANRRYFLERALAYFEEHL